MRKNAQDAMKFNFENLEIYKLAIKLIKLIYKLAKKLPKHEEYVLKPQLLRAATSIALNIAEGKGRNNDKEFARFLRISIASAFETSAILKILLDLGEVKKEDLKEIWPVIKELHFKMVGLERRLKRSIKARK